MPLKKFVVIGPESTGKSSLCEGLAAHYQTEWAAEYAREYLLRYGMDYKFEDLLTIAKGQLELEDRTAGVVEARGGAGTGADSTDAGMGAAAGARFVAAEAGAAATGLGAGMGSVGGTGMTGARGDGRDPILFIDTDMYVMKVWSEFVFDKCDAWILDQIVAREYDGYLLCCTDLPWVKDELREYPDLESRETLFQIYRDLLINQSTPWFEVRGHAGERLEHAIAAVDGWLGGGR